MKIGVAGLGAIGRVVGWTLADGTIEGCTLTAVAMRDLDKAAAFNATLRTSVPVVSFDDLAKTCDCVVECLPPHLFEAVAQPVLQAGKVLIAMSASQLLGRKDLIELARETGGRIVVPSGAILGLDALKAAALGTIHSVTIQTRKPPASFRGSSYPARMGIDLNALQEPVCVLAGTVEDVAKEFPANVNTAAAVSFAGIGPSLTRMEIWADPALQVNRHVVQVRSDSSDFTMSIENRPSLENPATGRITAQSVLALLRQRGAVMQTGT